MSELSEEARAVLNKLDPSRVPEHVAVIMDGNGRWARQRDLPRIEGHKAGAESVRVAIEACQEAGVKFLTLYAFSTENWVRPQDEIKGLMALMESSMIEHENKLHENKLRLRVIGRLDQIPGPIRKRLFKIVDKTSGYEAGTVTVALNYGGRAELVDAVRTIAEQVKQKKLKPKDIDEKTIAGCLYAPDVPDPDLMIRTSGEMRISNFLIWQLSYAELYVTDVFWPDFREKHFFEALHDFAQRRRRFGDVK